jgi:MOSC domain-containing protein YiiM
LDFSRLSGSERLRIGESLLEITIPCDPCSRMDEIRQGLRVELGGRRGWLCRVVETGRIKRGDRIEVVVRAGELHSKGASR